MFTTEVKQAGDIFLSVPDHGGMADMIPKAPEQVDWLVPRLERIDGVERVWETAWRLKDMAVKARVESMLLEHGSVTFSWEGER